MEIWSINRRVWNVQINSIFKLIIKLSNQTEDKTSVTFTFNKQGCQELAQFGPGWLLPSGKLPFDCQKNCQKLDIFSKKIPKIFIFLKKNVKFLAIFWHSNGNFPEGELLTRSESCWPAWLCGCSPRVTWASTCCVTTACTGCCTWSTHTWTSRSRSPHRRIYSWRCRALAPWPTCTG